MCTSQLALRPFLIRSLLLVLITVVAWGSASVAEETKDQRGRVLGSAKFQDTDFRDAKVSYVGILNGLSKVQTREFPDRWQVRYKFEDKAIFSELLMGFKRWSQDNMSQKNLKKMFNTDKNNLKTVKTLSTRNRLGPLLILGMEKSQKRCGVFMQYGDHPNASQGDLGTESMYSAHVSGWICFSKFEHSDIDETINATKSFAEEFFLDGGERNRTRNINLREVRKTTGGTGSDKQPIQAIAPGGSAITLTKSATDNFSKYLSYRANKAFAISPTSGAWGYTYGHQIVERAIDKALDNCNKYAGDCRTYAVNNEIVFNKILEGKLAAYYVEATKWFRKAAEQGARTAQVNLRL